MNLFFFIIDLTIYFRKLSTVSGVIELTALTFIDYTSWNSEELGEPSIVIVASVLGVLLVIAVMSLGLLWWYKIRPYEFKNMDSSITKNTLHNEEDNSKSELSPPLTVSRFDSVIISGSTVHGSLT